MSGRFAGWSLLLVLTSGCAGRLEPFGQQISVVAAPYVIVDGSPTSLEPGWGLEVRYRRTWKPDHEGWCGVPDLLEPNFFGLGGRFAWSHHEGSPGGPAAEYLRLGATAAWFYYPGGREYGTRKGYVGFGVSTGPTLHWILNDGPGDVMGFGLTVAPEIQFFLTRKFFMSVGATLDGWVQTNGNLTGTLSAEVALGWAW